MKNIYTQPKALVLVLNSLDIIASSVEEQKEIAYNSLGGLSDVIPY